MLSRVKSARSDVEKRKRQLEAAIAELTEARKQVVEAGGFDEVRRRRDEEKADRALWRSLATVDELKKDAWKWIKCRHRSGACMNDDCRGCEHDGGMWRCRFDRDKLACDRCLEAVHESIHWPDVIDEWNPNIREAWHRQAALPRYAEESHEDTIERAARASEWMKSRDDEDWESLDAPLCAQTCLGASSACTHGDSRSFYALKGVPGMALCSHHFDVGHSDRHALVLQLACVAWGSAVGQPDSLGWYAVPNSDWFAAAAPSRCAQCGDEQEARLVSDWWSAWRMKNGAIEHACATCYVQWRQPRCQMCNGEFSWKNVDELTMDDNVLIYTCGNCMKDDDDDDEIVKQT